MVIEKLKSLKLASPFRPFYLLLTDGWRFKIEHAHEFAIAPDGSRVGVTGSAAALFLKSDAVKDVDLMALNILTVQ